MTTKKPYIINKFVFCEKDGRDVFCQKDGRMTTK